MVAQPHSESALSKTEDVDLNRLRETLTDEVLVRWMRITPSGNGPARPSDVLTRVSFVGTLAFFRDPTGGHVGFVARTTAPGGMWAAERALGFLEALLAG